MVEIDIEDPDKHERVVKALAQINGLRYRYKGASSKSEKRDINIDSDEDANDTEDDDNERAEAKPSKRKSMAQHQKANEKRTEVLTLDDHIERMLLRTRTIALLKIANNTAEVLPDDDDDEEDDEMIDEEAEYEDCDDENFEDINGSSSMMLAVSGDRLGRDTVSSPPTGVQRLGSMQRMSSMQRVGSMRRPTSFRTASFRTANLTPENAEAAAALRLARKLSTFLNLPKVISYKDLEEITESLLDESNDESDEYAHLIDEHVDSARGSTGDDSSVATSDVHNASTRTLGLRHMATQKSLHDLHIKDDPEDLDLQQRRLYVENAGLHRYSSKKLVGASSRSLLRGLSTQRDVMTHKDSKHSLTRDESWRSGGVICGPGSITSLQEEGEDKDDDSEAAGNAGVAGDGVFGTTFDEHGYKQWRTEIKDDYLAWIRAKVERKKTRRSHKPKDDGQKPRWQLLYEAASKGRPSSASGDDTKAEPRKVSTTTAKRMARQSVA